MTTEFGDPIHSSASGAADLHAFCAQVFSSLSRSDQRRAADAYVAGLLSVRGRKSIRRIAERVGTHSSQSLQQFVNQSRWDAQQVRRVLADLVADAMPVEAWVIEDIAFVKNGSHSAAVARQFVPSLGRVVNCQLGTTVMATCHMAAVPVDWRLQLPESWDRESERRARARIDPDEHCRSYWRYLIDLVDDLTVDWGAPVAPVVTDFGHRSGVDDFLAELERRGVGYVVQVDGRQHVRPLPGTPLRHRRIGDPHLEAQALRDVVQLSAGADRETVLWRAAPDRLLRSQFLHVPVGMPRPPAGSPRPISGAHSVVRRAVVEWPYNKARPRAMWLTNLDDWPVGEIVRVAKLRTQAGAALDELRRSFGLHDYEGRSFPGWHHHVTLTSTAYLFHLLYDDRNPLALEQSQADASTPAEPIGPRRGSQRRSWAGIQPESTKYGTTSTSTGSDSAVRRY